MVAHTGLDVPKDAPVNLGGLTRHPAETIVNFQQRRLETQQLHNNFQHASKTLNIQNFVSRNITAHTATSRPRPEKLLLSSQIGRSRNHYTCIMFSTSPMMKYTDTRCYYVLKTLKGRRFVCALQLERAAIVDRPSWLSLRRGWWFHLFSPFLFPFGFLQPSPSLSHFFFMTNIFTGTSIILLIIFCNTLATASHLFFSFTWLDPAIHIPNEF